MTKGFEGVREMMKGGCSLSSGFRRVYFLPVIIEEPCLCLSGDFWQRVLFLSPLLLFHLHTFVSLKVDLFTFEGFSVRKDSIYHAIIANELDAVM